MAKKKTCAKKKEVSKKNLATRMKEIHKMWKKGKKELQKMEALVEKDGYDIKKLDKDELHKLLQKKEEETDRRLSEIALHVLVAGRCAGSYGCGVKE